MTGRRISRFVTVAATVVIIGVAVSVRWREPEPWTVISEEAPYGIGGALLLVYDPADCEVYRPVMERLEEAYGRGLDIRGIPVRKPDGRAPAAAEVAARPVLPDASYLMRPVARALVRLGYRHTPLLVSVDRAGRLRHVIELPAPAVEHRRTLARLQEMLRPMEET